MPKSSLPISIAIFGPSAKTNIAVTMDKYNRSFIYFFSTADFSPKGRTLDV